MSFSFDLIPEDFDFHDRVRVKRTASLLGGNKLIHNKRSIVNFFLGFLANYSGILLINIAKNFTGVFFVF